LAHIETLRHIPVERRRFWLFAIAKNILADYYRRRSVRNRYEMRMMESARGWDTLLAVENGETLTAIDQAIRRLPENLREVLALRTMGEMSSEEIGEVLGRPAGTIRYQLSQARKMINELLGSSE
jgi:RNA polymerase sigma-70 factor (ECF subfamily)